MTAPMLVLQHIACEPPAAYEDHVLPDLGRRRLAGTHVTRPREPAVAAEATVAVDADGRDVSGRGAVTHERSERPLHEGDRLGRGHGGRAESWLGVGVRAGGARAGFR
jgi:hypothetical protein